MATSIHTNSSSTGKRRKSSGRLKSAPLDHSLTLSVDQAAQAIGISRAALYSLWATKKGPAFFLIGTRRLVRREALQIWLAKMEQQPQERV